MKLPFALPLFALLWLPLGAWADALSAAQAREWLSRGALAWDVRPAGQALLPAAVRADLNDWAQGGGVAALEQAVSAAGIDLSRDVVIYGAVGDPQAHVLYAQLAALATGRVHWLVGGIDEWRAAGLPTVAQPAQRLPVPQRLVRRASSGSADLVPAAPSRRQSATEALALAARD